MNKYEREVALSQLNSERHTLDELKEIYRQAIEEVCEKIEISDGKIKTLLSEIDKSDPRMISVLQSQIYQKKFQQSIKNQLDFLLKDLNDRQYASISEYLSNSYDNGFIGTLYSLNMNDIPVNIPIDPALVVRAIHIESKLSKSLYEELGEDVELLKRRVSSTISRGIASNMHYSDIARNIANNSKTGLNRAMTITRTEGNRIYNTANLHSGRQAKAKTDADLIKQWDSTLDGVTRPHHRQLDGQVRELDELFEIGNRKALAPLQFGIPGEDINCRCICLVKPRWDVDETFTKRDNASGELLEFEGTKDYEDFKRRYWRIAEDEDKQQYFRPIILGDVQTVKRGKIELEMRPVKTSVNDIYVSKGCKLKRKELHNIDTRITVALKKMGISNAENLPTIHVISHSEMQKNAVASYNAVTNIISVDEVFGKTLKEISLIQQSGACPDNELSTLVHEMFHWTDAQDYQKHFGKITADNYSDYINHLNKNRKKIIDKLGINEYNVSEISQYALDSLRKQKFDEIYTEYRTKELLR
jgi:SPP1 gp7 family putative phage head morphogenesis protein